MMSLSQIAHWVSGRLIGADATVSSVETDSRRLRLGALFVALRGPRFDGHDYASQAASSGAVGLLVTRKLDTDLPQILVLDTQAALEAMAAAWRATMPGQVIGVTGSNGKTTTKELIAAILGQVGSTAATKGNLNNAIGVPLTLLAAQNQKFLVVEMGANHPGEIAQLTAIARPDVAVITNAGRAHLEGFGSLEGVARAKGEIIGGLGPEGTCVLNANDTWLPLWKELAEQRRVLTFGSTSDCDVALDLVEAPLQLTANGFYSRVRLRTPRGPLTLELALAGHHSLMNTLAAVAVAEALNVDHVSIRTGLSQVHPVSGRLCPLAGVNGSWIVDDSYNANPDSVLAALAVLKALPAKQHWLILGDLAELGPNAIALHRELGQAARDKDIDCLWAVGSMSNEAVATFGTGGKHFVDRDALIAELAKNLQPDDLILIKGSRSAGMDQVVRALATN